MGPSLRPVRQCGLRACVLLGLLSGLTAGEPRPATTAPTGKTSIDPQGAYRRALEAVEHGRCDEAVALLEPLHADHPTNFTYGLLLADAYLAQNHPDKARPVLSRLSADPPDDLEARLILADVLERAEQWSDIIRILKPLAQSEGTYEIHHRLAGAYAAKEQTSDALAHYTRAIDLRPDALEDHHALGDLHAQAGRYGLAAAAYLKTAALGSDSPELAFKLAAAFVELGNYIGEVKVRPIPEADVGQLLDAGYILSPARGREETFHVCPPASALYQIQRAFHLGLDTPASRLLRAGIWLAVGSYDRALEDYKSIEDRVPPDKRIDYHFGRARAHLELHEYDEYIEHTRLAARETPDRFGAILAKAYLDVAERFHQRGDLENNILFLRQADRTEPRNPIIHLRLGYAYWDKNEHEKAVEQWRILLELEPEHRQRATLLELIEEATRKETGPSTEP